MEFWLIMLIVCAVVLGAGVWVGVESIRRHRLEGRQDRWRELEHRFDAVTMASERYDRSPADALAAPGWLDRSSSVVRGFSGTLTRAVRDRAELERTVAPAPGRAGRRAIAAGTDHARTLNPSPGDLQELEHLVERVEDAYRDADRAVRTTGWSRPETLTVPHVQFLLDPRWGRPAVLPRQVPITPRTDARTAERAVKEFLDAAYPLRRDTAVKLIRERSGGTGPGFRAQKSFERLLASGRYAVDGRGFIWPGATVVEQWGVYRTFGRDAELGLDDVAPVEVANALWTLLPADRALTDAELLDLAREHLHLGAGRGLGLTRTLNEGLERGLKALPPGVQKAVQEVAPHGVQIRTGTRKVEQVLAEGLHEALITGRLQRRPDGLVRRLRTEWPSTYRR